ncbi:MAG: M20 family metallopeptidase [Anaerolineae bacterium]|nr:M20 family metallopeptidase [Anaerolineae bacterium]
MKTTLASSKIMGLAQHIRPQLIGLRRYLHQHPELSGEEQQTAQLMAERLTSLGLSVRTGVGGHGVVAQISGEQPGRTVAYRTEMDALPLSDTLETDYASLALGVSHACGHDVHMAVTWGTARILAECKKDLHGQVRFILQPAEEALDGAQAMIAHGVLEDPVPRALLALHTFPLPVGAIGLTPGCMLAGMEEFRVRFDAAEPALSVLIASALTSLNALNTITPPETSPAFDALIARMVAGTGSEHTFYLSCWQNPNVFSTDSHITGLVSLTDEKHRQRIRTDIQRTLDQVVKGTPATYEMWTSFTNPPVINNAVLTAKLRPLVADIVGDKNVYWFRAPFPFAHEDFALYAQRIPASLLWLGTANQSRGIARLLHTPDFDVDEEALVTGTAAAAYLLFSLSSMLAD